MNQASTAAELDSVGTLGALSVQLLHRRSNRNNSHGDSAMSHNVVGAVGDRSLAHTKSVINTSAIHDKLHTHVVHLCRWLDTGSDQHARGHRRVSPDFAIFTDLLRRCSCKLRRDAPFLAVPTDDT